MALTYTTDPTTTTRCRRRLHLHSCKHRYQWVLCFFFTGIFHKRYLFVLSILYIVGLITCAGRLLTILHPPPPPLPGSLYRSHELFLKLWPEIQSDNASNVELDNLWRYRRKLKEQRPCLNANAYQEPVSSGLQRYLVVEANGGLNQQRSSICNAVAVAGLLNATRVIPRFDLHNVWKDPRQDCSHFSFANRLATSIPPHIQFLRCLANYKALRFSSTITNLAKTIVNRMIGKSLNSGGKYVSVHLRFEEDMVAFSCCIYDEGETEKSELDAIRKNGWGKKFMQTNRIFAPDLNRVNGRCPMTPVEVGMMLRGMGFSNDTPIYLASGKIYKEERF
ncbi:hypothetical protein DH2020_033961 [Rehmannia glutinosa]|uniref:O-fucosyltransferase family protein n=1 Tax=Rehmannia glutinosa TaxID=99300 RepID=A0ABR0VBR3_REHGL